DRKHPRTLVVFHLYFAVVREQKPDVRSPLDEARELARTEDRIELSVDQHLVQRVAGRDGLQIDPTAELQGRPLIASRFLLPSAPPTDVRRMESILFREDAAHPDVCRLLIFGQPDELPLELRGAANAPVRPDKDGGVTEMARHECRDRDVGAYAA